MRKTPDVIEPFVGYRRWNVSLGDLRLVSTMHRVPWTPREDVKAECVLASAMAQRWMPLLHLCPEAVRTTPCETCPCTLDEKFGHIGEGCGVYAYNEFERVLKSPLPSPLSSQIAVGEVYLWGQVYEYEHGYRAEFARVKALYGSNLIAQSLARIYGVPLIELSKD